MGLFGELSKIVWERKVTKHFQIAILSAICRIGFAIVNIVNVRILSEKIGIENYALYTVLINLIGWFILADFGIGNSLQNFISEVKAEGKDFKDYVLNAFLLTLIALVPLVLGLVISSPFIAKHLLHNFTQVTPHTKSSYLNYLIVVYSLGTLSNLVTKIWFAERKGHYSSLVTLTASLISLGLMLTLDFFDQEKRLVLALVFGSLPQALILFVFCLVHVRPIPFKLASTSQMKALWNRAIGFWQMSILGVININMDSLIIAKYASADFIVQYGFVSRLFSNVFILYSQLLLAVWPVLSERIIKKNVQSVIQKINDYIKLGILIFGLLGLVLYLFMSNIQAFVLPTLPSQISKNLILLFTAWFIIRVWTDTHGVIFSVTNNAKVAVKFGLILVPLSGLLQIAAIKMIGNYGILMAVILAYLVTAVWYYPWKVRNILKEYEN